MRHLLLTSALLALSVASQADATVTTFSGQDDGAAIGGTFTNSNQASTDFFAAALPYSPLLTNGFEAVPTGFQTSYALPMATVTLSASADYGDGFSGVSTATFGNAYGFDVGSGSGKWLGFPDGSATFTFTGTTHAFGFYATGVQTQFGDTFQVSFDDGTAQTFDVPINDNGGVQYFGVVDTNSFSSITISRPGNDAWGIDNVSFGFPAAVTPAVPEPASWAMMLGGFGLIGGALRTTRRRTNVRFA